MKSFLGRMSVANGIRLETGTAAVTRRIVGLIIRTDTVIAAWTAKDANGRTIDLVALFNISGVTLYNTDPAFVIPGNLEHISYTLTSGTVWEIMA